MKPFFTTMANALNHIGGDRMSNSSICLLWLGLSDPQVISKAPASVTTFVARALTPSQKRRGKPENDMFASCRAKPFFNC
jgi:hypothetical protein